VKSTPLRDRRFAVTALKLIVSLLVIACVAFIVERSIFNSGDAGSLSAERQAGLSEAAAGDCASAVTLLRTVIAQNPNDSASEEALAGCYVSLDDFASALTLLQDVARTSPDVSNELGVARAAFFDGNTALVQSSLKIALAGAGTASDFLSIANAATSYGLNSTAALALNRTRSTQRTYTWYDVDAQIQLNLGNPGIAVSEALRAVQLSPHSTRASMLVELGNTYVGASEYAAAANAYRGAISTHQQIDDADVDSELAQCYINLGRYLKAIAVARSGLTEFPDADQYSLELSEATALADLHQSEKAVKILRSIIVATSAQATVIASASALLSAVDG
jgi:tetratricopeptide (TPR) repeat protein